MMNFPRRSLVAFPVALLAGCLFNGGSGPVAEPAPIAPPIEPPPTVPPRITAYLIGVNSTLAAFDVDPETGLFTQVGVPASIAVQPDHFVVDPAGKFAYVISNVGGQADIVTFGFDETGAPVDSGQTCPAGSGLSIAMHPSGRFLYAVDPTNDLVQMFTADDSGHLSPGVSVQTGAAPAHVSTHPGGMFAYVSHNDNGIGSIRVYAIDDDGVLSEIDANRVDLLANPPGKIVIDGAGRFAYVAIFGSEVWAYEIDAATGAMTFKGQHQVGRKPLGFAVDPSGRFLYAAADEEDSITALQSSNGVLSFIDAYATGARPDEVVVDASGRFVYVVNDDSESVSVYAIDRHTGALMPKGPPFALPSGFFPDGIVVVERPR
jgi:6-phosphogluconolactonase (cycloisomerase 2 family)